MQNTQREEVLEDVLSVHGLLVLGHRGRLTLIGNAGGAMWRAFEQRRPATPDPLDAWTRAVIEPIAMRRGAEAVFPFDRPYPPIRSWAQEMGVAHPSPIGLLVHPLFGLWHAYRAALRWPDAPDLASIWSTPHSPDPHPSPCTACPTQPCLSACPVSAFAPGRYDVDRCRSHLRSSAGSECMELGCRARRACPIGASHRYQAAQIAFHMRAFAG